MYWSRDAEERRIEGLSLTSCWALWLIPKLNINNGVRAAHNIVQIQMKISAWHRKHKERINSWGSILVILPNMPSCLTSAETLFWQIMCWDRIPYKTPNDALFQKCTRLPDLYQEQVFNSKQWYYRYSYLFENLSRSIKLQRLELLGKVADGTSISPGPISGVVLHWRLTDHFHPYAEGYFCRNCPMVMLDYPFWWANASTVLMDMMVMMTNGMLRQAGGYERALLFHSNLLMEWWSFRCCSVEYA